MPCGDASVGLPMLRLMGLQRLVQITKWIYFWIYTPLKSTLCLDQMHGHTEPEQRRSRNLQSSLQCSNLAIRAQKQ